MSARSDRKTKRPAPLLGHVKERLPDEKIQAALELSRQYLNQCGQSLDKLQALKAEQNPPPSPADASASPQRRNEFGERTGEVPPILRIMLSQLVSYFGGVVEWPNDPSSATGRSNEQGSQHETKP